MTCDSSWPTDERGSVPSPSIYGKRWALSGGLEMYVDLDMVSGAGVVLLVVAVAAAILWKVLVERWRSGL
jgi:hypothetical protein